MLSGTNKEPKGFVRVTGIGSVRVLTVNPTTSEYNKLTSSELPYELTYDVTELNEVNYRPVKLLVHNAEHDVFAFVNFWISDQDEISKKGDKVNSMDPKGVMTYIPVDGSGVDYAWFDSKEATPLKRGESLLHNFLQILVKYDQKAEEANWREELVSAGCTAKNLYSGDTTGLQALIDWANEQFVGDNGKKGHQVGVLFEVKKSAKKDKETGEEVPGQFNFNQVINGRHFFFASADGNIPQSAYNRLQKIHDDQEKAGYSLTKNLWTAHLQEFDEATSNGREPEEGSETDAPEGAPAAVRWV